MSVVRFRPEAPKQNPKLFGLGFCFFVAAEAALDSRWPKEKLCGIFAFSFLQSCNLAGHSAPRILFPLTEKRTAVARGGERRRASRAAASPPRRSRPAAQGLFPALSLRLSPATRHPGSPPRPRAGFPPYRARRGRAAGSGAARSVFRINLVCDRGFKIRNFQKARFRRMSILRGALFAVLSVDRSPYIVW